MRLILKWKLMENIQLDYCLWERPTPSEPANLFYEDGVDVVYWTGVTTELFISGDVIVANAYDGYGEKSFNDYLVTGGADEYSGYYADYYYAEVENGEIISLATSYGP